MNAEETGKKHRKTRKKSSNKSAKKGGSKGSKSGKNYPFDFRLKAVRFKLEEGYTTEFVSQELGISKSCTLKPG